MPEWPADIVLNVWECKLAPGIVSEGQVLTETAICMDNATALNISLWARAANRYHEAAEVCRGR